MSGLVKRKISQLDELTTVASTDVVAITDVSDTTQGANGSTKKITKANLVAGLATDTGLSDHISDTTTHGTTGDIVGTSDSQVLTNKTINVSNNTVSNVAVSNMAGSAIVTESETIASNDNDTTLPTSAAVKDNVDSSISTHNSDTTSVHGIADTSVLLDTSDIGSSVQAWDTELDTWATKAPPSGTVVGHTDTQTLTNKTISASGNTISNLDIADFAASAIVTEGEGIGSNDNDTTLPTSAAVKDYVDSSVVSGGAVDFIDLGDVPSSYSGQAGKAVAVASGEDGLEFVDFTGGGGDVSVSGTPSNGQYARFVDEDTIQGVSASGVRSDLDLVIGTDVQAWDADLDTWATKTAPSGTVVGTSDSQVLTNKTISASGNTISNLDASDIQTGTLVHERGGLEANVSAYTGLLAVSGGSTSEVDSKSELEAQIADVSDFAMADGDVYTGVHNFGGATSFEIPNATNVITALGEIGMIAFDTEVAGFGDGNLRIRSNNGIRDLVHISGGIVEEGSFLRYAGASSGFVLTSDSPVDPGGASGVIQYNANGVFGGVGELKYTSSDPKLIWEADGEIITIGNAGSGVAIEADDGTYNVKIIDNNENVLISAYDGNDYNVKIIDNDNNILLSVTDGTISTNLVDNDNNAGVFSFDGDYGVKLIDAGSATPFFMYNIGGHGVGFNIDSVSGSDKTVTFPNATGTLVLHNATQTLTNKTIDANGTGNSITNLEVADFAGSAIVTESEGIGSNDNDTTLPTSAAVKDYVDNNTGATDFLGLTDTPANYTASSGLAVAVNASGTALEFVEFSGGVDDGDKGDITVSSSGATWTIDNDAVTYAKMQNVVADNVILGNNAGAGGVVDELTASEVRTIINVEDGADVTDTTNVTSAGALMDSEVDADIKTLSLPANTTISSFGKDLIDDAAASNARTTLELGTLATASTINNGDWSGTDLEVANGGTGRSTLGDGNVLIGAGTSGITSSKAAPTGDFVGTSDTQTLTNKTIDANGTGNSITNLEVADLASGVLDTDLSSVSGSDDTLASAKAIKAYADLMTPISGWIAAGETWTFSSWDANTRIGVLTVPTDATTKYGVGMRVRISQSTGGTKYGIIHAVSATTLTIFFPVGTTLNDETVSSPSYSMMKAPFGFSPAPDLWKTEVIDSSNRDSSGTTSATWYNFTALSIPVGIGKWNLSYSGRFRFDGTSAATSMESTLSTTTNSETIEGLTDYWSTNAAASVQVAVLTGSFNDYSTASAVTLSLLARVTSGSSITRERWEGPARDTHIQAISAYL